jgi:mono/diheme cytochrome c family protein
MLFALSTGHQIGLAGTGGAFILFALLSSFVFPRLDPNFPGKKGLRWYLPLSAAFFLTMIGAVLVFGKESKKGAEAATAPPAATTTAASAPSAPAGGDKLTTGPYANGDAASGKTLFAGNGCGACHTLKAAGTTGVVGPSLDKLKEFAATAKQPLGAFIAESIADPAAYIAPGYANGMPPFGTTLSKKQIGDLVAFVYDSVSSS